MLFLPFSICLFMFLFSYEQKLQHTHIPTEQALTSLSVSENIIKRGIVLQMRCSGNWRDGLNFAYCSHSGPEFVPSTQIGQVTNACNPSFWIYNAILQPQLAPSPMQAPHVNGEKKRRKYLNIIMCLTWHSHCNQEFPAASWLCL